MSTEWIPEDNSVERRIFNWKGSMSILTRQQVQFSIDLLSYRISRLQAFVVGSHCDMSEMSEKRTWAIGRRFRQLQSCSVYSRFTSPCE